VLALATTEQSAKRRVVGLSPCRPVANDVRQTAPCHIVARFKSKNWLNCQAIGRHCDNAPHDTRRFACFARDTTTRRQCDNAPFGALSCFRWLTDEKAITI
jgi:hypothetical protein